MREARRFDPLGWLLSTSFAVLTAAGALALAVYLVRHIWLWILIGSLVAVVLLVGARVALWWHRSQPW